MTSSTFSLASLQATIFTPDEEVSVVKLQRSLIPSLLGRFDREPIIPPYGELPVPRDVPRVILQGSKGGWRCEIGSARVNVFFVETSGGDPVPAPSDFFHQASQVFAEYEKATSCRIGRLAAVVSRFARHESPARFLADHFCQDRWLRGPLNRPENFELHAHKTYNLDSFRVNSWMRVKTAFRSFGSEARQKVVLVEQDLNTLAEESQAKTFSVADAESFLDKAFSEFSEILELYFPE